jgi:hypothetical protein
MTAVVEQQALDDLHRALKEADLPGVEILQHPQHIAVIADSGDFAIWVSPWGRPTVYKVEGATASHRCGATRHVVNLLRQLIGP